MAVSISTMGGADYFREHGDEHRQAAIDAGGYFVQGHGDGEPAPQFLGGLTLELGLSRHEDDARSDEIVKATWTKLEHPTTGQALGSAPRRYASPAENLAKIAASEGLVLPEALTPSVLGRARASAEGSAKVDAARLAGIKAAIAEQVTPEEADALVFRAQKAQRENVALYDATYSPDKSISVFHLAAERVGDHYRAKVFEDSSMVGTEALVSVMESELAYSRTGHHGVPVGGVTTGRREQVDKVAVAAFMHHTSREGDPQDHVHAAVLNRVRCADGQWRALDGQAIYHARATLNVVASRAQEAYLRDRLGLRFERSEDGSRRIAAVDRDVCAMFSKRAAVINERLRQWEVRYTEHYGHPPDARLRVRRADEIARATRPKKAKGVTRDASMAAWGAEADARGRSLDDVYAAVMADCEALAHGDVVTETPLSDNEVLTRALDALKARQSSWTRHHLIAEIDRHLPANIPVGMSAKEFFEGTVLRLAKAGLRREGVVCLVPDQIIDHSVPADMANRDGLSLYLPRGAETYVDEAVLVAEAALLAEALREDAPAISASEAQAIADHVGLVDDQGAALAGILSSGRSLEVLIGPAGTGKSYTLSKLAAAWERHVARSGVVGLTVSENAAEVLRAEGFERATNLARWFKAQERIAEGKALRQDRNFVLRRGQLIVVDEASMASSADIARVVDLARPYGAKVLLTGDHRQLAAVSQGGALGLLAEDPMLVEAGAVHELSTVRRFQADWEREASLRLRDGDETVLDLYDDHGRIIAGTREDVEAELVADTVGHLLVGRVSSLTVGTAAEAAALSLRIRSELIKAGRVNDWSTAKLHDGTEASKGDLIQARKNAYEITDSDGQALSNRDLLEVQGVNATGAVLARRLSAHGQGATVVLGREYVANHVELAYASTVHAAQGRTVTAGAQLVDPEMTTAEALYVGGTRGRLTNRFYVVVPQGDDRRGVDVLKEVLERRGGVRTATEIRREQDDAARSLARIGPVWADAVGQDAANKYRDAVLAGFKAALGDDASSGLLERIEADSASPAFWQAVSTTADGGYDVSDTLASTLRGRNLDGAQSQAQVLHHRLMEWRHMAWEPAQSKVRKPAVGVDTTYLERSPEPESLVSDLARPDHASYARHLAAAMDAREAELGRRVAVSAPEWATKHLGPVPVAGSTAHEAWVARAGVVAGYREQYLAPSAAIDVANPIGRRPSRYRAPQRYVDWQRANEALGITRNTEVDVTKLPDAALVERVERWAQAQEQAPPWVKAILDKAHHDHRKLARSYDQMAGTAKVMGPRMAAFAQRVEDSAARVEALQAQHDERGHWYGDTTEIREAAAEARAELARRYPDGEIKVPTVTPREEMAEREARRHDAALEAQARQAERDAQRKAHEVDAIGVSLKI